MTTITATQAVTTLTSEGYPEADVLAAIDSLIAAGLDADQPDDETVLTPAELDILRDQLIPAGTVTIADITRALREADIDYDVKHPGTESASVWVGGVDEGLALGPGTDETGRPGPGVDSCDASGRADWHPTLAEAVKVARAYTQQ